MKDEEREKESMWLKVRAEKRKGIKIRNVKVRGGK